MFSCWNDAFGWIFHMYEYDLHKDQIGRLHEAQSCLSRQASKNI